jgi:hypothetical protein
MEMSGDSGPRAVGLYTPLLPEAQPSPGISTEKDTLPVTINLEDTVIVTLE